jgi:sialidase-1
MAFLYNSLLFLLAYVNISFQNESVVFSRGENGYFCIKIPSILTTSTGTLIAFGEARLFSCSDYTQTDIVYKRSFDNGQTWSKLKILYQGNASTNSNYTRVGNIAPVQLKFNNRILIPFCKNNLIVMQTYSDDDGLTFSQPEVIPNVTKPSWKWVGLGPPGGLLLKSNRILIPSYYSLRENDNGLLSIGYVMLNDHNGQLDKWYLGGEFHLDTYFPNECQAVELLNNNSIFINARSLGSKRVGAFSNNGGLTFDKITLLNTLVKPLTGCEGSTIYDENTHQLFYSGLKETSYIRSNLSLFKSKDNGENWTFVKTIFGGSTSYSSLTIMNQNKSVGLLYEWANNTAFIFVPDYINFTIAYNLP